MSSLIFLWYTIDNLAPDKFDIIRALIETGATIV
jgi:hypothetical protein